MKFDSLSLLVTTRVDVSLQKLEERLKERGYTLGYRPSRSSPAPSLRTVLNERRPNLLATRYGEIDDICVALKVRTKWGIVITKNVPRAATGPDFKKIFIGSRGLYGKLMEATLKIFPVKYA